MTESWSKNAKAATSAVHAAIDDVAALGVRGKATLQLTAQPFGVEKVVSVLEQFPACVRYLNTRRSSGAVININSEADIQDVVYLMLRPWITDLVPENPTDELPRDIQLRISSQWTSRRSLRRNL